MNIGHSSNKPNFIGINYIKAFACISVLLVHFRFNLEHLIPKADLGLNQHYLSLWIINFL